MSIFHFGRKNRDSEADTAGKAGGASAADSSADNLAHEEKSLHELIDGDPSPSHNGVDTEFGPYDGDSVDINEFDFSEFGGAHLDLGSMKVAVPKDSQIQVEMGDAGPVAVHVVTPVGRMTMVAFAAPRSSGQWDEMAKNIADTMEADKLNVRIERGTWGNEVVGDADSAQIRVIGVDGPRWMLRTTVAAPIESAPQAAKLAREMIARSFVYRGSDPILAGQVLPVTVPPELAAEIERANREQQALNNNVASFAAKVAQSKVNNPNQIAAHLNHTRAETLAQSAEQIIAGDNASARSEDQ